MQKGPESEKTLFQRIQERWAHAQWQERMRQTFAPVQNFAQQHPNITTAAAVGTGLVAAGPVVATALAPSAAVTTAQFLGASAIATTELAVFAAPLAAIYRFSDRIANAGRGIAERVRGRKRSHSTVEREDAQVTETPAPQADVVAMDEGTNPAPQATPTTIVDPAMEAPAAKRANTNVSPVAQAPAFQITAPVGTDGQPVLFHPGAAPSQSTARRRVRKSKLSSSVENREEHSSDDSMKRKAKRSLKSSQ